MKHSNDTKTNEAKAILDNFLEYSFKTEEERINKITEFADLFCDLEIQEILWKYALEKYQEVNEDSKKELIVIGLFEILAEEPVSKIWLKNLLNLLSNSRTVPLVTRAYKYSPEKLWEHLCLMHG